MITYLHPILSKEYVWLHLHTTIHLNAVVLGHRGDSCTALLAYGWVGVTWVWKVHILNVQSEHKVALQLWGHETDDMWLIQIILVATTFHGAWWSHISDNSDRLLWRSVQTNTGAHPGPYSMGTWGVVQAWCATVQSPSGTEVKNEWSYASMAFTLWGVITYSHIDRYQLQIIRSKRNVILAAFQLRCYILSPYNLFPNVMMDRV